MRSRFAPSIGPLIFVIVALVAPAPLSAQIFTVTPDLYSIFTPSPTPAEERGVTGPVAVLQLPRPQLEPAGIWAGGQHFLPSVSVSSDYDSNIFATEVAPAADAVSHLRPQLDVENGTRLISYHLNAYGDFVSYLDHSNLDNANYGTALDIVGDPDPTLRLESRSTLTYGHLDPANFVLPVPNAAVSHLPATQSYEEELSAIRDVNRWGLGLTGGYIRSDFEDVTVGGVTLAQSQMNSNVFRLAPRVSYDVTPLLRGIVQGEYSHEADAEGSLNASTYTATTGLDFELRRLLRGTVTVGYTEHLFDQSQFGGDSGPTYGLSLAWYPSERLTVSATGKQDFTSTIISGVGGTPAVANVMTAQLQVDYDLSQEFVVSGIASYEADTFQSTSRSDMIPSAGVNLLYLINRNWIASAQGRLMRRDSTQAGFSYERVQFGLGLKLRL
jgi:hypothetical protein